MDVYKPVRNGLFIFTMATAPAIAAGADEAEDARIAEEQRQAEDMAKAKADREQREADHALQQIGSSLAEFELAKAKAAEYDTMQAQNAIMEGNMNAAQETQAEAEATLQDLESAINEDRPVFQFGGGILTNVYALPSGDGMIMAEAGLGLDVPLGPHLYVSALINPSAFVRYADETQRNDMLIPGARVEFGGTDKNLTSFYATGAFGHYLDGSNNNVDTLGVGPGIAKTFKNKKGNPAFTFAASVMLTYNWHTETVEMNGSNDQGVSDHDFGLGVAINGRFPARIK